MRICIYTAVCGEKFERIAAVTNQFKVAYAKRQGYDFLYKVSVENNPKEFPHWLKISVGKKIMETRRYDYICWIDADAAPVNFDLPIEKYITNEQVLVASQCTYGLTKNNPLYLNSGVFMIKCCNYGIQILDEWMLRVVHRYSEIVSNTSFKDQDDINNMVTENWHGLKEKTIVHSIHDGLNSVTERYYKKGHLILHVAGGKSTFNEFLKRFWYNLDKEELEKQGITTNPLS